MKNLSLVRAAIFIVFLLNRLCFVSQNIAYFSFCPFNSVSQMVSSVFSILQAQPEGQLAFPCCIWPKETGCHHLTQQRLLNPHSRCGCLLFLEFLRTIYPRHHQPVSPITGPSFLHQPLFPKLSSHPAFDVPWWGPSPVLSPFSPKPFIWISRIRVLWLVGLSIFSRFFLNLLFIISLWQCRGSEQASSKCVTLEWGLFWAQGNGDSEGSKETIAPPLTT